jgi:hypothetical protein
LPYLPFDEPLYAKTVHYPNKLKLGVIKYDGFFYPCKSVRRAIDLTVEACEKSNIQVYEIDMTKISSFVFPFVKLNMYRSKYPEQLLMGEKPVVGNNPIEAITLLPDSIKTFIALLLKIIWMK